MTATGRPGSRPPSAAQPGAPGRHGAVEGGWPPTGSSSLAARRPDTRRRRAAIGGKPQGPPETEFQLSSNFPAHAQCRAARHPQPRPKSRPNQRITAQWREMRAGHNLISVAGALGSCCARSAPSHRSLFQAIHHNRALCAERTGLPFRVEHCVVVRRGAHDARVTSTTNDPEPLPEANKMSQII